MTGTLKTTQTGPKRDTPAENYSSGTSLVDFILGITFEIWEQRKVDKIKNYYAGDVEVYSLEAMVRSAGTMIENTQQTLVAFPDRLLVADDVITTGSTMKGFSSHRLVSPMTNQGETVFGPATGRQVQTMNIADCVVENGMITREWLVRDNLALVNQLGFDPLASAHIIAERFDTHQLAWLASEYFRTLESQSVASSTISGIDPALSFARIVLNSCWVTGDRKTLESVYAPYCVLKRAPFHLCSGREQLLKHYSDWRITFPGASLNIDHVCSKPFDQNGQRIAVRWSIAGLHEGEFAGVKATGKPVYVLGVTHWQLIDGRITAEWTVFDELAMLAQTLK